MSDLPSLSFSVFVQFLSVFCLFAEFNTTPPVKSRHNSALILQQCPVKLRSSLLTQTLTHTHTQTEEGEPKYLSVLSTHNCLPNKKLDSVPSCCVQIHRFRKSSMQNSPLSESVTELLNSSMLIIITII